MPRLSFAPPHLLDMPFAANGIPRVPLEPNVIAPLTGGGDLSTDFSNWDHTKDPSAPQIFGNVQYDWYGPVFDDGEIWGYDSANSQIVRSTFGVNTVMAEIGRLPAPGVITGFGTPLGYPSSGPKYQQIYRISPTRVILVVSKETGYAGSAMYGTFVYFATWNGTSLSSFSNETILNFNNNPNQYPILAAGSSILKIINDVFIITCGQAAGYFNSGFAIIDVRTGTPVKTEVTGFQNPPTYTGGSTTFMALRPLTTNRFIMQHVGDTNTQSGRTLYSVWDYSGGYNVAPTTVGSVYADTYDGGTAESYNRTTAQNIVAFPDGRIIIPSFGAAANTDYIRVLDASTGAFTFGAFQYLPSGNGTTSMFGMLKLNSTDFLASRFVGTNGIYTSLGRLRADNSIAWLASMKFTSLNPPAVSTSPNGGTGTNIGIRGGPGFVLPSNRAVLQQNVATTTPNQTVNNMAMCFKA